MNTKIAQDNGWLFNGESFCKRVSGFGDLSKWEQVSDSFKEEWDKEHPIELEEPNEF